MSLPKLLVFAGPGQTSGSGFETLVKASCSGRHLLPLTLHADIVGVVSTNNAGGVRVRAEKLGVPFFHAQTPCTSAQYQELAERTHAQFFALSGWLQIVRGLDSRTTFNIHPGSLPETAGLYGLKVHEKTIELFAEGDIRETAITMHFVTNTIDGGPVIARIPIPLYTNDTLCTLGRRISDLEHWWQPRITNLVVNKLITWDGNDPNSLRYPNWYTPVCRGDSYLKWQTS